MPNRWHRVKLLYRPLLGCSSVARFSTKEVAKPRGSLFVAQLGPGYNWAQMIPRAQSRNKGGVLQMRRGNDS
jgi:hypothetical protein